MFTYTPNKNATMLWILKIAKIPTSAPSIYSTSSFEDRWFSSISSRRPPNWQFYDNLHCKSQWTHLTTWLPWKYFEHPMMQCNYYQFHSLICHPLGYNKLILPTYHPQRILNRFALEETQDAVIYNINPFNFNSY